MSRLLSPDQAAPLLAAGDVVGIPTETVYGLAANALDENAVHKIFKVKGRPPTNPIIAHLGSIEDVFAFGDDPGCAALLAEKFWPGPMTLLLPHKDRVPRILTAGSDLCGFRIPAHPLALNLLKLCKFPLAAPSANLSNRRSPTTAAMVLDQLGDLIAGVIDGGPCQIGIESSVIEVVDHQTVRLLRPGQVTRADLEALELEVLSKPGQVVAIEERQASPGLLAAHYQPDVALVLLESDQSESLEKLIAWLLSQAPRRLAVLDFGPTDENSLSFRLQYLLKHAAAGSENVPEIKSINLSETADPEEVAYNLFRIFDQAARQSDLIVTSLLRGPGLNEAINDRLLRAASRQF